jgi:hypothetical protein
MNMQQEPCRTARAWHSTDSLLHDQGQKGMGQVHHQDVTHIKLNPIEFVKACLHAHARQRHLQHELCLQRLDQSNQKLGSCQQVLTVFLMRTQAPLVARPMKNFAMAFSSSPSAGTVWVAVNQRFLNPLTLSLSTLQT